MKALRFRSLIEVRGINPYVRVSARRAARLQKGWRKPLPVRVRVNGKPDQPWRINLMPAGDGSFYLYLHGEVRNASNTKVGDVVTVELEFDEQYRGGPAGSLPVWFAVEFEKRPVAREAWDRLSPSRQKELVRYLSQLKSPDAQRRNTERALEVLSGKTARFMGRLWKEGA